MDENDAQVSVKPAWLAPALVIAVVVAIWAISQKRDEAAENPVVEGALLTVIVFAFAWLFRKVFGMLDAPGAVAFFGGPLQTHPDHASTVDTSEAY